MAIECGIVTGAAHWASYLVNGDDSGLDAREKALCDAWAERLARDSYYVVDVARDDTGEGLEPRFSWSYGLHTGDDCRGGDVLDYVVHRERR